MTGLRAIETIWKNYRMRSRAEARWACFMDRAGIEWSYESEGYELDGARYLPDFYLPSQDCWLEVKGAKPDQQAIDKAMRLSKASSKQVYIISGEVGPEYRLDSFWPRACVTYRWCMCLSCKMVGIANRGNAATLPCACFQSDEYYVSDNWRKIADALLAARQERFGT